jgi:hypothetical protein
MLEKSALSDFCSSDVVYFLSGAPKLIGNFNSRLTIGQKAKARFQPRTTDLAGSGRVVGRYFAIPFLRLPTVGRQTPNPVR